VFLLTFVNDNVIRDNEVKSWIDNEEYFAGIKNGENVFIAFVDGKNRYIGFHEFNFIKIPHDYKDLENKDDYEYDVQFVIISRNHPILKRDIKHYLDIKDINHIYTKEYIKNVLLRNFD
jgi:hypothetical protein